MKIQNKSKRFFIALIVVFLGIGLTALSFLVDYIGLSQPGFLGIKQIYLFLLGISLCLFGGISMLSWETLLSLGGKFVLGYQQTAIIVLNIIFLVFLFEIILWLPEIATTMKVGFSPSPLRNLEARYLHPSDTNGPGTYQYYPYAIYRHAPYSREGTNISEDGIRLTPEAKCGDGSYRVFVFGGSTIFGTAVADNETIPAYLQVGLSKTLNRDVCVVNYGARGWVSTQGVIMLMMELQKGHVPDLVISYEGINDSVAAKELHWFRGSIEQLFEDQDKARRPTLSWLRSLRSYKKIVSFLKPSPVVSPDEEKTALQKEKDADVIVSRYLANLRFVKALSKEYDFKFLFAWQPIPKGLAF